MKKCYFSWLIIFALCLLAGHHVAAQSEEFDKPLLRKTGQDSARVGAIRTAAAEREVKIARPEGYPAKDLPETYSGWRIEIVATDTLLADTSEVFFRHGNVVMETLPNNRFSYTIGDFQSETAAAEFMKRFILPTYNEPAIIRYEQGQRKW